MNFLDYVFNFLGMIGEYIATSLKNSIAFIGQIFQAVGFTYELSTLCPSIIGLSVSAVVAVSVIKSLLGRHTG